MVAFLWPNPFYQEDPSRAAHAPSRVSLVSDELFGTAENIEGSVSLVPSSNPSGYQLLSPRPPQLTTLPESDSDLEQEEPLMGKFEPTGL